MQVTFVKEPPEWAMKAAKKWVADNNSRTINQDERAHSLARIIAEACREQLRQAARDCAEASREIGPRGRK